jgi:dipeptidyl aminopeptidase/acylaminoacyl peptidase
MTSVVRDGQLYGGVQLSRDGTRFTFTMSDGDRPAELYTADAAFSTVKRLSELNPWITNKRLPKSELVAYRDVDGKRLYGILRYPVDYQKGRTYPTVFEIYETFFDNFYTDSPRLGVRNTHAPEKSQDRIKTPLLNITGDQDPNVPASQSGEMYYALRRLGKEVEWVRYVNGGHRPPNSATETIDFEQRILGWYDKYLKKDPKKSETITATGR